MFSPDSQEMAIGKWLLGSQFTFLLFPTTGILQREKSQRVKMLSSLPEENFNVT